MRLVAFDAGGRPALGVRRGDAVVDLALAAPELPSDLRGLLRLAASGLERARQAAARADAAALLALAELRLLPPVGSPGKIICIGLNYVDHAKESPYAGLPKHPVTFARFANSLVGHDAPLVRPRNSVRLDWEGELAAIVGKRARHVPPGAALDCIAGYSVFNDGSVRDYQFHSHQWLMGKSFDATGGFGPEFVTADEVPPGASGLRLQTRVNGAVMQEANTRDMIFGIAALVSYLSEAITLEPGDVIVTGTPAGVGFARKPEIFLQPGDVCEVEIEGIGTLRNRVIAETP